MSQSAIIAKAVFLKNMDKLVNSREYLKQAISLNPKSFQTWIILSEVHYKLYCWEEVESTSRQALQLMKPHLKDKLYRKIQLRLIEAKSRSSDKQKWEQARQMCKEVGITV